MENRKIRIENPVQLALDAGEMGEEPPEQARRKQRRDGKS